MVEDMYYEYFLESKVNAFSTTVVVTQGRTLKSFIP